MSHLLKTKFPISPIDYSYSKGSWIYDKNGQNYLDASSGAININIGHQSNTVTKAIQKQIRKSAYSNMGTLINEEAEKLAGELSNISDGYFTKVMFSTSGTTGIELAISLARLYHRANNQVEKTEIISCWTSYHGSSVYTLALSGHRRRRPPHSHSNNTMPSFSYPYKGFHSVYDESHICTDKCADEVAELIERMGESEIAALLIEPISGATGGALIPPENYLKKLKEHCNRLNVLLIYDEVMVGLGRVGYPFAFNKFPDSEPDICVVSKGLGAGYTPISAVLLNEKVTSVIEKSGYPIPLTGTMAGNPLSCTIGLSVLEELNSLGFLDSNFSNKQAENMKPILNEARIFECVKELRGDGFFYGMEFTNGTLQTFLEICKENNLFFYPFNGFKKDGGNGILIAPPLNSTKSDLEFLRVNLSKSLLTLDNFNKLKR